MELQDKEKIDLIRNGYFPLQIDSEVIVRPVSFDELYQFVSKNHSAVFPSDENQQWFTDAPDRKQSIAKMRAMYSSTHFECFLVYHFEKVIGWHLAEAEDMITFYLRNSGVLPEYQDKGYGTAFLKQFCEYIGAVGYERVTSQHQATNRRILILMLRQGFDIAGMELTERWGPLIKLVKLLQPDRRDCFYKNFGALEHLPKESTNI